MTGAINTNITNIATNTGNIASNTTAIGTLSGQVAQNSEDIAELQDSIFFSSAYSADYPSSPNRDPEDGNMYLQNFAMFTYSYAEATQIFCSKTDESGNVRQFTAIQAGDSIVLNEVDSPNYGRYELVTVEDVSDSYVVMNVIPKKGQGTVITGVKVAFQAFPKPDSGAGDGIPEAPIDGKQYGRQDAEWTEVTGGGGTTDILPVLMSGRVNQDGTNQAGFGFEASKAADGIYTVNFDTPLDEGYVVSVNSATGLVANVFGETFTQFKVQFYDINGAVAIQTWQFSLISLETKEVGGGSGGSGGGETQPAVTMSAGISATSAIPSSVWVPVVVDDTEYDTNDCLDTTTGKYTPNVEGYYLVNASTKIGGTGLIRGLSAITLNNTRVTQGSEAYNSADPSEGITSTATSIVYCNGTTDYIQMQVLANGSTGSNSLLAGLGTQLNVSLITGQSTGGGGGTTPLLYEEVYPNNISDVTSLSYTPLTGALTADVVAGKKYQITGGTNAVANNQDGVNTYSYWKLATVLNGGTAEDTLCNMVTASQSSDGGVGSYSPMERSFTYTATESGTLELTAYCKVAGTGGGAFQNNVIRIKEVAETTGSGGGSYTPEKMVWEDETDNKVANIDYTNTNDVPIYLDVTMTSSADGGWRKADLYIDGVFIKTCAKGPYTTVDAAKNDIRSLSFIVPSGSVYRINSETSNIQKWWEAKMPVAVGTGGDSIWTEPNDSTTLYESDNATVTQVRIKSGDSSTQIVQYPTGQSYFKGDGPTYFGNNSDSPVQLTQNNVTMLTATADGIDIPQDITVNGVKVGQGGGDITSNTSVGTSSLLANTTGNLNSAFGAGSLQKNTTGIQNTAVGYASLQQNEYGVKNTAVGFNALQSTQYKDNQTAVGNNALKDNKQSGNTAVGSACFR